ncbi:MAG: hypothetical protein WA063_04460 [Minisyncoccia bacterium]
MEKINQNNNPTKEKSEKKLFSAPDGRLYNASNEEIEKLWDVKYVEKVNEFYNNKRLKGFDDESDTAEYKHKTKEGFIKMADNHNIKEIKPEEAGMALSFMAGQMEYGPHLKGENKINDPEMEKQNEIYYQKAKEVFMESCKKIFPEVDKANPMDLIRLTQELDAKHSIGFNDVFKLSEVAEIVKVRGADIDRLKNMADRLEEVLHYAEGSARDKGWGTFESEIADDPKADIQKNKKEMAGLARCIYELILIRDTVYEKLYGNKNISVEDAKKMDEARENIEKK